MLKRLIITNVALIERLDMDFDDGFNVLTGETGAGKSIIIDAVNLVLGERASRELIKSGADKATVEAEFDVSNSPAVNAVLAENEIDCEDELTVSRELSISGKNICRINGTLVNLTILKRITDLLVDVHGQHEHQSLLSAGKHMAFLDAFAHEAVEKPKAETARLYKSFVAAKNALTAGFGSEDERAREADILRYQINEIEKAHLTDVEEESITSEKALLANAERIMSALTESAELISGDNGAAASLGGAAACIKNISELHTDYAALTSRLDEVYYTVDDIGLAIRDLRNSFDFDPDRLNEIELRLETYSNIKKKYGDTIEEVNAFCNRAKERLYDIEFAAEKKEALERELKERTAEYLAAADALSAVRRATALEMQAALLTQLKDLGMEKARFSVVFSPRGEYSSSGIDKLEFLLSANLGEELKPLEKVASGGEMSRIMLAFKAIAADADMIPTLIFDEIDTGISGRVADAVGAKMVNISDSHQVLCVTHLPQIAALADVHYLVEKSDDGNTTHTELKKLTLDERCEYVGRMMGGSSSLASEHARELINASEHAKKQRRSAIKAE